MERLERKDLREWIASMSREGLAPSSVGRAVSAARGFYRFLMLDGHIKRHPAEDLHTPQRVSRLPQFLTEEEMERLLFAPDLKTDVGVRDRTLLEVMYATGLRVSELCGLRTSDVELDAGLVTCHGKGSKQRRIPIGKSANQAGGLGDYQDLRRTGRRSRYLAAHIASQLWHSSDATRRRFAFGAGAAGPRGHFDHRNLHAHHRPAHAQGLRSISSAGKSGGWWKEREVKR